MKESKHNLRKLTALSLLPVLAAIPFSSTVAALGDIKASVEINSSTLNGPTLDDEDQYGRSIAGIGDLDGDGINDLAVGAKLDSAGGSAAGTVHIHFLNSDGSVKSSTEINSTVTNGPSQGALNTYGISITLLGDLDGDGIRELAVGAGGNDTGGTDRGAIYIHYMNSDGSVKSTVEINSSTPNGPVLEDNDNYGANIAALGDYDGDGINEIAVAAISDDGSGSNRGAVHIHFMNADGSVKSTIEINDSTPNGPTLADDDTYGNGVTNIGDFDGDGVSDLAVSAINDDKAGLNRGALYLHFMNIGGSRKSTTVIDDITSNGPVLNDNDRYGHDVANLGDLDGNGYTDLLVGAREDDNTPLPFVSGNNRGTVYIHLMAASGAIKSTLEINSNTLNGPTLLAEDHYGRSVTNLGDLDGDGFPDIAIGALFDDEGGSKRGAAHIHFLDPEYLFELPSNQWKQFSLPCDPTGSIGVIDILADDMPGGMGGIEIDWALWSYEINTNEYVRVSNTLNKGVGYWIIQISGDPIVIDMPFGCEAAPAVNSSQCTSSKGCYEIPVATAPSAIQWNMQGYPYFSAPMEMNNIRVTTDSGICADTDGCTLDEAASATTVHNHIWHYNGSAYDDLVSPSKLSPWSGFWIPTLESANGLNPKLLIPKP